MNVHEWEIRRTGELSEMARRRMLSTKGEPFFFSEWRRAVFMHFETDAEVLQREVPFELDLHEGKAYVSLVAFHLERMRPRVGGKMSEFLTKPVATHELLNIRVYVRHNNEVGIYFLAEYLPNKISLLLGPTLYGLPYRYGRLNYQHKPESGEMGGNVYDGTNRLDYHVKTDGAADFYPCIEGTLDEFLLERYTAFTYRNGTNRLFRIWHPPWPQTAADVTIENDDLLASTGEWFQRSRLVGAHYSPGFDQVWMSRPRTI